MSILPSVDTSQTPTPERTAFTSRVTRRQPVVLAGAREPLRAQPLARLHECSAALLRPAVTGGEARGLEVLAAMRPGKGADRDGRVGRARGGRAQLRDGALGERGHDGVAVDAGGLALIGRHAERGVALQQLDRAIAFACGERHVRRV